MLAQSLLSCARRFGKSEDGAVAFVFGLLITAIVGVNVFAAEYTRAVAIRSEMQKKLDATLLFLSAGDDRYTPQGPGSDYLRNMVDVAGIDLDAFNPEFTWSDEEAMLTGVVNFRPRSIVSGGFYSGFEMTVKAGVSPKMLGAVELALVLDSSGSMLFSINDANSNSAVSPPNRRIDALHNAVTKLFDAIYENPTVVPKVAVIPYANTVDISQLFVDGNSSNFRATYGRSWNSLEVDWLDDEDIEHHENTDDGLMRKKGIWATERYQSQNSDGSYNLSLQPPVTSSLRIPITSQQETREVCSSSHYYRYYSSPSCSLQARRWDYDYYRTYGYFFPHIGVLPQTTDSQAVRDFVRSIEPRGGTAGHIGAIWGLYALSPDWDSIFDHPAGTPGVFGDKEKHLVIMTDGQFNSPQTYGMNDDDIFDYFQSACDLAAANGVTVYTVGLLLQNQQMDDTLSNCVTHPKRYYKVDSAEELSKAFENIGRVTTQVRISS